MAHARFSNNIKCCCDNYDTQIQKAEIEITPTAPIMTDEMICV